MLVLSRKIGESIIIGQDIELMVVSIEGDNVRLGIKAPKSVEILRKELYASIQAENAEASGSKERFKQLLLRKSQTEISEKESK